MNSETVVTGLRIRALLIWALVLVLSPMLSPQLSAISEHGKTGNNHQAQGDVLDDLNTLGAAASDGQFIVATGAGAFAYESADIARTSLGLGTGDSPQFTGLTLTGNLTMPGGWDLTTGTITIDATAHTRIDNFFQRPWVDTNGDVWGIFADGLGKSTDKGKTFVIKDSVARIGDYGGRGLFQDSRGYIYWSQWGTGTLRRSIDGGDSWDDVHTWTDAGGDRGIWGMCEDSLGYLYAGLYTTQVVDDDRIFRSTDGGANWSTVYDGDDRHVHDVACDPYTDYIYATTGDTPGHRHILRSIDNGDTWTTIISGYQCLAINFLPGMRLFGDDEYVDGGVIWKTTDDATLTAVYIPPGNLSNFSTTKKGNRIFFGQVSHTNGNTPQIVSTIDGDNWEVVYTGTDTDIYHGPAYMSNFGPNGNCYVTMSGDDDNFRLSDTIIVNDIIVNDIIANDIIANGVGIGTTTPGYPLHIDGTYGDLEFHDVSWGTRLEISGPAPDIMLADTEGYSAIFDYSQGIGIRIYTGNSQAANGDLVIQDTTGNVGIGTENPQGKLDVNGSIYQRGGQLHADYVFGPSYELESIEEHSEFMWRQKHLKAIPKVKVDENGREIIEVGAHRKGVVEELEKAHIYIEQLHQRIKALEEKLAKLEP